MVRIQRVRRTPLVETVMERLRSVITDGQLQAGDRLPGELELVERLGVSRPALREAISRLEALGVIDVVRGRGMYVGSQSGLKSCARLVTTSLQISTYEKQQFAEFRAALEIHAARLAAENATDAQMEELRAACAAMDEPGLTYEQEVRADFEFHRKIAEIGGNPVILSSLEVVQEFILTGMVATTPNPRNYNNSRILHGSIVDAIAARDPIAASAAMKVHMDAVRQVLARKRAEEERARE
jgi:GntR family transcriptional repressor for pyruvate dehydrogenase complex